MGKNSQNNKDTKVMCHNLMKEMLWKKSPNSPLTIEMFSIKKHMQKEPSLKNRHISDMNCYDYKHLKTSAWA